jgi:ABC-type phosphate transport system auxiliary subunit
VQEHFPKIYKNGMTYRATGITLQNLGSLDTKQATLFDIEDSKADKFEDLHKRLDALQNKFGKKVIHLASTQGALKNMTEDIDLEGLERNLLFT